MQRNLQNIVNSLGLELDVELSPVTQPVEEGEEPVVVGDTLRITHREYGADKDFTVVSDVAGVLSTVEGLPLNVDNGHDIAGTINKQLTYGKGRVLSAAPGTAAAPVLAIAFVVLVAWFSSWAFSTPGDPSTRAPRLRPARPRPRRESAARPCLRSR